jgi:hypothetical protein
MGSLARASLFRRAGAIRWSWASSQRIRSDGAYECDLLTAGRRRHPARAAGRRFPNRPRSEVQRDHERAVRVRKAYGCVGCASWGYDSGLVAGAVASLDDALALTADQQTAIGFLCGNQVATRDQALTSANRTTSNYGATVLKIPAEGTANDVSNPPRVVPRHLLHLGIGADNLLHTDRTKLRLRFSIINLTNKDALYEFLSTFSGTHFVTPRAFQLQVGVIF